jgi:hypothetical protein
MVGLLPAPPPPLSSAPAPAPAPWASAPVVALAATTGGHPPLPLTAAGVALGVGGAQVAAAAQGRGLSLTCLAFSFTSDNMSLISWSGLGRLIASLVPLPLTHKRSCLQIWVLLWLILLLSGVLLVPCSTSPLPNRMSRRVCHSAGLLSYA